MESKEANQFQRKLNFPFCLQVLWTVCASCPILRFVQIAHPRTELWVWHMYKQREKLLTCPPWNSGCSGWSHPNLTPDGPDQTGLWSLGLCCAKSRSGPWRPGRAAVLPCCPRQRLSDRARCRRGLPLCSQRCNGPRCCGMLRHAAACCGMRCETMWDGTKFLMFCTFLVFKSQMWRPVSICVHIAHLSWILTASCQDFHLGTDKERC